MLIKYNLYTYQKVPQTTHDLHDLQANTFFKTKKKFGQNTWPKRFTLRSVP